MVQYYIGVDVGSSAARAGLFNGRGNLVSMATHPITIWNPCPSYYEQSSDDIWQACCSAVKKITSEIDINDVRGIGFDATCSLVVLDESGKPLTVSLNGENDHNIIMWMDHRAETQADEINSTKSPVLKSYGGKISLEMELPKLLWLKQNLLETTWKRAKFFFELPDFLTWCASGSNSRSLCSVVCKWGYQVLDDGTQGWPNKFLIQIGLEDLVDDNYAKIGSEVLPPGTPCHKGLTAQAALQLGLKPNTPVGTSIIDAHCGGVGCIGSHFQIEDGSENFALTSRLPIICGTSTCNMAVSQKPVFVPGVWGPYYSAMLPGLWLNESGQSAAGKMIDHIIKTHPAFKSVSMHQDRHVQEVLNDILEKLKNKRNLPSIAYLTQDLHVWPDFHGNRSPLADPTLRGMISGLTLDDSEEDLACLYLASVQALAYGVRHILDTMSKAGYNIQVLIVAGGLGKNTVFIKMHANITGLPIVIPNTSESVLLGGAILGACASKDFPTVQAAMEQMSGEGTTMSPAKEEKQFHDKKYAVFLKMVEHQMEYRQIMKDV